MLSEEKLAELLGRSLTSVETANFETYLNIATQKLEELLCVDLSHSDDEEDRTFGTRNGYRTVYVDFYTTITSVTRDGETVDSSTYVSKQNDRFNGTWYNILEFEKRQDGSNIVVNADWGFDEDEAPEDLLMLLALLFAQVSVDQKVDGQVKSKKIEDFTVTYKDSSTTQELIAGNSTAFGKYGQCDVGAIRNGRVCSLYY